LLNVDYIRIPTIITHITKQFAVRPRLEKVVDVESNWGTATQAPKIY